MLNITMGHGHLPETTTSEQRRPPRIQRIGIMS